MMNQQQWNRKPKHWPSVLALIGIIGGLALVSDDGLIPVANAQDDLVYVPLDSPCRVANTRNTASSHLIATNSRDFFSYGSAGTIGAQGGNAAGCDHPRSSEGFQPAAIAANVTAVGRQASGNGNITAYPAGAGAPSASTVNYTQAANIANSTIIALRTSDGSFTLLSNNSNVPAIVDVVGYFYSTQGADLQVDCSADANALISTTIRDNTTFNITGSCNGPIYVSGDGVRLVGAEPNRAASIVLPNPTLDPSIGAVFADGAHDLRIENLTIDVTQWGTWAIAQGTDAAGVYARNAFVRLIDSDIVGGLYGINPFRNAIVRMQGTINVTEFVNAGISAGDHSLIGTRGQVNISTTRTDGTGYIVGVETYRLGIIDFRAGVTISVPDEDPGNGVFPRSITSSGRSHVQVRAAGTNSIDGIVNVTSGALSVSGVPTFDGNIEINGGGAVNLHNVSHSGDIGLGNDGTGSGKMFVSDSTLSNGSDDNIYIGRLSGMTLQDTSVEDSSGVAVITIDAFGTLNLYGSSVDLNGRDINCTTASSFNTGSGINIGTQTGC